MDFLFMVLISWVLSSFPLVTYAGHGIVNTSVQLVMRPERVNTEDYYCTSVALPKRENYIVGFEPFMHEKIAHHMLVFGCDSKDEDVSIGSTWDCKSGQTCGDDVGTILYAWAKEAPGLRFPKGVGIKVGETVRITAITMQVHFHHGPHSEADYPRLNISLTTKRQPKVAGVYLMGGMGEFGLPPGKKDTTVDVACKFSGPNVIHPLGFRTHAHSLSPLIAGFVKSHTTKKWKLIGQHSPQKPQAFYPVRSHISIHPGDIMAAQCHYDTTGKSSTVTFGSDSGNEMCNFYVMFYMKNNGRSLKSMECWNSPPKSFKFPSLAQLATPTKPADDNVIHHDNHNKPSPPSPSPSPSPSPQNTDVPNITLATDWAMNTLSDSSSIKRLLGMELGQVTGISVDDTNHVYMFHRGNHVWDENSFTMDDLYKQHSKGPIKSPTLLVTDSKSKVTNTWGSNIFYLPHGLTIDSNGIIWLTDVARHQVFKLPSLKKKTPLALGASFKPGHDRSHFCKPAAVAVDNVHKRFYIADGYCNHRIMIFTTSGSYIGKYSHSIEGVSLEVPHSLTLSNNGTSLYVADRENYRIVHYNTVTGHGSVFVSEDVLNGPVYAIVFSNKLGQWPMYAVTGARGRHGKAMGFTINEKGVIIGTWSPMNKGFGQPHDIAVNSDGSALYVSEIGPNKVWKFNVQFPHSRHQSIHTYSNKSLTDKLSSSTSSMATPTITSLLATPTINTSILVTVSTIHVNTSSCQPTPTPNDETSYKCPRPPPPPIKCCHAPSSNESGCVYCSEPTQIYDGGPPVVINEKRFPILSFLLVVVIMCIILILVLALVLFVRHRKKTGTGKPLFNVRRHYSRNPKKKLDVLLNSEKKNGFSRVRTFDSESDEEFTVFQKT